MKSRALFLVSILFAFACGGGNKNANNANNGNNGAATSSSEGTTEGAVEVAPKGFIDATNSFAATAKARGWSDEKCAQVAGAFKSSAGDAKDGKFAAAHYDAAIVFLQCGKDNDAAIELDNALNDAGGNFPQVFVQKALIRFRKGDKDGISEAITMVKEQGFSPDAPKNIEAFVTLGMLYRERFKRDPDNPDGKKVDNYGGTKLSDDLERAQWWIQNALAINADFMPAYNQLALFYLDKARAVGNARARGNARGAAAAKITGKADIQTLETGLLVALEAARRDADYAPILNTQGLIFLEMNHTAEATQSFQKAAEKDPRYFEAWMNFAAINLAFRGYDEAARGYKAASDVRPKDYDAKLGYAVSVRGQLDLNLTTAQMIVNQTFECDNSVIKWEEAAASGSAKGQKPNCDQLHTAGPPDIKKYRDKFLALYTDASAAYDAAILLDPERPEALYDQALLVDKYEDKKLENCDQACNLAAAQKAYDLYQKFHDKFQSTTDDRVKKLLTDDERQLKNVQTKLDAFKATPPPEPTPSASPSTSVAPTPAASAAPSASH